MAKPKSSATKAGANVLQVHVRPDEDEATAHARAALMPGVQAGLTIGEYCKAFGELSLNGMIDELREHATNVQKGDLGRVEAMLSHQAHTLDAIFNNLARRAALNAGEYMGACDTYLRLALKAQSQCRATLETIAEIKNPPIVIARQANVTTGPQQVNNGIPADVASRARQLESAPNQLLEESHGEQLDCGTKGAATGIDSQLAAVGEFDRAEVRRR